MSEEMLSPAQPDRDEALEVTARESSMSRLPRSFGKLQPRSYRAENSWVWQRARFLCGRND